LEAVYGASEAYDTFRSVFEAVLNIYEETWDGPCFGCNPYEEFGGTRRSGDGDFGARSPGLPSNATLAARMDQWSTTLREVVPDLQRALASFSTSDNYATSSHHKSPGVGGRRRSLQQVEVDEIACEDGDECGDVDYDYADFTDEEVVEVAPGVKQVQLFWAGETKANGVAFLGVYHVQGEEEGTEDAVVLKLNSFSPEYGAWAPMQGPSAGDIVPFFTSLAKVRQTAAAFSLRNTSYRQLGSLHSF
jgi:hypothetical protein